VLIVFPTKPAASTPLAGDAKNNGLDSRPIVSNTVATGLPAKYAFVGWAMGFASPSPFNTRFPPAESFKTTNSCDKQTPLYNCDEAA
jgi:hypothetical protein